MTTLTVICNWNSFDITYQVNTNKTRMLQLQSLQLAHQRVEDLSISDAHVSCSCSLNLTRGDYSWCPWVVYIWSWCTNLTICCKQPAVITTYCTDAVWKGARLWSPANWCTSIKKKKKKLRICSKIWWSHMEFIISTSCILQAQARTSAQGSA